jgi:hypothetical protein
MICLSGDVRSMRPMRWKTSASRNAHYEPARCGYRALRIKYLRRRIDAFPETFARNRQFYVAGILWKMYTVARRKSLAVVQLTLITR